MYEGRSVLLNEGEFISLYTYEIGHSTFHVGRTSDYFTSSRQIVIITSNVSSLLTIIIISIIIIKCTDIYLMRARARACVRARVCVDNANYSKPANGKICKILG